MSRPESVPRRGRRAAREAWSEARVHRWLFRVHAPGGLAAGFGHDAATLSRSLQRPVVCIDQCIEGVHFEPAEPRARAAAKAALRALSDLAAAAARPRALLFGASFPRATPERDVRAAIRGVAQAARAVGAELVAGDLACAEGPAVFSVAAVGELGAGPPPPRRDAVRVGDWILSTGPFGGSRLGRHLCFEPRLAAGRWLWRHGARAMTDVSDGLARDAARLAARSGVALELCDIPIHRDARRAARASGRSALEHALYDGEDHELLVALAPARARALLRARGPHAPGLACIGRARLGRGVFAPREEGAPELEPVDPRRGWTHGAT